MCGPRTLHSNVVRDNALINPSGKKGKAVPVDLNTEHCVRSIKTVGTAKGIRADWSTLGDVSASITVLSDATHAVVAMFDIYDGSSHTTPDTSKLVWQVYEAVGDLMELKVSRPDGDKQKLRPDLLGEGQQKLITSGLTNFNKNMRALYSGLAVNEFVVEEEDELPPMGFSFQEPEEAEDENEY
ncbi:hypothetical protein PENSPDRAFT_695694 [Peniophora sp. CONT]|nr:hypothetical protein PENSPDRAFT_695694 [Peniophora sp. CONT]